MPLPFILTPMPLPFILFELVSISKFFFSLLNFVSRFFFSLFEFVSIPHFSLFELALSGEANRHQGMHTRFRYLVIFSSHFVASFLSVA